MCQPLYLGTTDKIIHKINVIPAHVEISTEKNVYDLAYS
jgi:hypothetical protein